VCEEARGSKNRKDRVHMIENRKGLVDLKALGAGVEGR